MSDKPRRFQIHLLTAVVLMITAGGLLWMNMFIFTSEYSEQHQWMMRYEYRLRKEFPGDAIEHTFYKAWRGWPRPFWGGIVNERRQEVKEWWSAWDSWVLVEDVTIALTILCAIAVVSEWMITRKKESFGCRSA